MSKPSVFRSIKSDDVNIKPFKSYKNWTFDSGNYSGSGYAVLQGVHTTEKTPIGSVEATNDATNSFDGSYQAVVWKSIDHMYYRFPYDSARTTELSDRSTVTKFLFVTASTIALPYLKTGEQVKPGSFRISIKTPRIYNLSDDGVGNIIDLSITTSSFAPKQNLVAYWGFNNEFRRFRSCYGNSNYQDLFAPGSTNAAEISHFEMDFESNTFQPEFKSKFHNISFNPGLETSTHVSQSGIQIDFEGDGYVMTNNHPDYNFGGCDEFAVSCWVKLPDSQAVTTNNENYIISKKGVEDVFSYDKTTAQTSIIEKHVNYSKFPFLLSVYNQTAGANSGKIVARRSDGIRSKNITSSMSVTGNYTHILYQKTGSNLELYINGTLDATLVDDLKDGTSNPAKLMFGSMNKSGSYGLSGSLDEVRIYNTALNSSQIISLANNDYSQCTAYQTAVVGNMFYKFGQCVISSPMPKYHFRDIAQCNWTASYKSTHTIYENEIFLSVPKDLFNMSLNPSATYKLSNGTTAGCGPRNTVEPGEAILPDFSGSLRPYISSIGLYNDNGELLAVAKLAQPIQKRDDIDMNFVIRYDI